MSQVLTALPLPEIYYHPASKSYWREDAQGKWIPLNQDSAAAYVISQGYDKEGGVGISEASRCILEVQTRQNIDYAGPLAGYDAGFYKINGRNVLVTESPRLIEAKPGEWPLLKGILEGMFGEQQLPYVYGWLKKALECYQFQRWSPGQILVMAGPVNSAKSLLQRIITELVGGRSAKPYLYMTGNTTFNADLFYAEHLMVEDEAESTDYKARRHFGAQLKGVAVNRDQHCHGKHEKGLTLTPIWRMSITLNNEPERLMVLPSLDDDVADKIMLLKVTRQDMPMPTETAEEQDAFWRALLAELPAFAHFLQNWSIPEPLRSPRFGINHFHHPELVSALRELSAELSLLFLIDMEVFRHRTTEWQGSAAELQRRLLADSGGSRTVVSREVERLLSFKTACGTYLGYLAKSHPDRVAKKTVHGQAVWTIQPPACAADQPTAETRVDGWTL